MAQQNLDFNIVAHTKGMEAIASLINRVGALETEIKKVQQANAGLAASSDAVIRNGVRYNNAMDAQSKALRNARMGTQQLGMQINDFATSVSTGASPIQAFNQQLGQLGYAMSMMGGTAGRVGAFLAGPWGAAITIATMGLGVLWERFSDNEEAAKDFNEVLFDSTSSYDAVVQASREYNDQMEIENRSRRELLVGQRQNIVARMGEARAIWFSIRALAEENRQRVLQGNLMEGEDMAGALFATRAFSEQAGAARDNVAGFEQHIANLNRQLAELDAEKTRDKNTTEMSTRATRENREETTQAERAARALFEQYENGTVSVRNFIAEVSRIGQMEEQRQGAENFVQQVTRISDALETSRIQGDLQAVKDDLNSMNMEAALAGQNLQQAFVNANPLQALPAVRIFSTEMQQAFADIGASVDNAFKGMLTGAMGWKDAMRGIIQSVIDQLWKMYVTQKIVGFITGALESVGVALPKKAAGGSVNARTPYMVGEKGPELFIPGGNGTIIPNKNVGYGGEGGNSFNITVDARGSSDPAAVRAQVQRGIIEAAPAIIAAAEKRTMTNLQRPRLAGAIQ